MRLFYIISIICSSFLLQGCLSAALIGSTAVITKSIMDPRSIGRQIDDGTLEACVNAAIYKDPEIKLNTRIITIAYEGKILLIGQAPDLILAKRATQIASQVKGVKKVYNEIRKTTPVTLGRASEDTWITTKIKSQILTNNLIKSSTIKVITENGEVFLLGILTPKEGYEAAKIASKINGVKHVNTAFTYID